MHQHKILGPKKSATVKTLRVSTGAAEKRKSETKKSECPALDSIQIYTRRKSEQYRQTRLTHSLTSFKLFLLLP
jgi:hypothetical protein